MLNTVEIPNDNYTVAIGNTPNATGNSFGVGSLINALKLDAIKSYQGILTNNNSSLSAFLNNNGVDKSSSAFNNAGIKPRPNPSKPDYSMYYIGSGIGVFFIVLIIIFSSRQS